MVFSRSTYLVWFKRLSAFVITLTLAACGSGGGGGEGVDANTLLMSWTAPSKRADGSALQPTEISGYRIYYGTVKGIYPEKLFINTEQVVGADVADIPGGDYFIVLTTIDTNGRESDYSIEYEVSL